MIEEILLLPPVSLTPVANLKGTVSRDFLLLVFFLESVSPKPLIKPLGLFRIFSKFAEIFAAQDFPPVSLTPVANCRRRR